MSYHVPIDAESVTHRGVSWAELERRIAAKDDAHYPRFAYLDGVLELVMSPLLDHERASHHIGALVGMYALEKGIEISGGGAWLLEDKLKKAGLEPDECFIIGPYGERTRPDFAIEVVRTHGGLDKLEIYRRLGIDEVWFWVRGRVEVHLLRDDAWTVSARSASLPALDLSLLCAHLDAPSTTAALRGFRDALRAG